MESTLKQMFGGGSFESNDKAKQAQDFVNRYEQGDPTEGYSKEEALQHYQQVAQHASPETMQRATKQAVERLNPDQRSAFAKMLQERQSGQVQRQLPQEGAQSGGGIDDILGGLLGGGAGGGGIGNILGSLVGGGGAPSANTGAVESGNQGGGIGDILGSNVGKAIMGGIAAYAMKEILDNRK
ncbi:MAG TPA: hypothetical protein VFL82_07700 [Thermomicrobiales bacterium]|jgi:hypothetical protein|nr:hypothetical protein [Thermomicrobiales bacterium]